MTASQLSPSYSRKHIEIRPKEVILLSHPSPLDHKRKRHAQTQKHQRDRMKAALEELANTLSSQGVGATGTKVGNPEISGITPEQFTKSVLKAEVVEMAVEYILGLQREIEGLRGRDRSESL